MEHERNSLLECDIEFLTHYQDHVETQQLPSISRFEPVVSRPERVSHLQNFAKILCVPISTDLSERIVPLVKSSSHIDDGFFQIKLVIYREEFNNDHNGLHRLDEAQVLKINANLVSHQLSPYNLSA